MNETILFCCGNGLNSKELVRFLNPLCKGLSQYSGNAIFYTLTFDSKYKIISYQAYMCRETAEVDKTITYTFNGVAPDFMTFPKEIRDAMIERTEEKSPIPFLTDIMGGFLWTETKEGGVFWDQVIVHRNFNLFYKHFKNKNYESRLCNKETPVRGDSDNGTSGIRSRFNKARVTIKSLSYKEISGRG